MKKLQREMEEYYNNADGYLAHLNMKRGNHYNYYVNFLKDYLSKINGTVLEVGCGDGYSTKILSELFPKIHFIGTDLSKKFIEYAQKEFPGIEFKQKNALQLTYPTNSFDAVISTDVLEHVTDVPKFIDESLRVIKPEGLLIIVTKNYFNPTQCIKSLFEYDLAMEGLLKKTSRMRYWINLIIRTITNTFWCLYKMFNHEFIYKQPNLAEAEAAHDSDAVYHSHQLDIKHYLKNKAKIINVAFGPKPLRKILQPFLGIGIVAQKKVK